MAIFQGPPGRPGGEYTVDPLEAGRIVQLCQAEDEVVAELEQLLEEARRGELLGLVYAGYRRDRSAPNRFCGRLSFGSLGALVSVTARLTRALDEGDV